MNLTRWHSFLAAGDAAHEPEGGVCCVTDETVGAENARGVCHFKEAMIGAVQVRCR